MTMLPSYGQDKPSKADGYYKEYLYEEAINEYKKEKALIPLKPNQLLNLANAYFKIKNYSEAAKIYTDFYKSGEKMSGNHFNVMLQSIAKTTNDINKVKAFFNSKSDSLSSELIENANFNFELFESNNNIDSDFKVFNVKSNSRQSDMSPAFYKEKLLFSSARIHKSKKIYAPSGESYLDVYISRIEPSGNVFSSVRFTDMPKSKFHKSTPYYSEKLNKIFYILSNTEDDELSIDDNGKNALALGVLDENMKFNFLLKDLSTSFYYPFYDDETQRLFFAANFEGGYGGTDIYFVYTNNGQIMSAPVNLGPRVNSPGNEIAPFMFENSLYFSSDIFYGMGGMDVYKTNFNEDGQYSIPVNLGQGINSLTVRGQVSNLNSKRAIDKAKVSLINKEGELLKEVYTNESGEYRIEVPWQEEVAIQSTKEKYSTFSMSYTKEKLDSIQDKPHNINIVALDDLVEEKEKQTVIKLNKFYFDNGRTSLKPEIETELDKVVEVMKSFPQLQLRIESHTDSRGGSATNFRLSQKRADAMKAYLMKKGVSASSILYAIGYGEDKITNVCKNGVYCLEMLHKQNQRTLIVILNYNLLF